MKEASVIKDGGGLWRTVLLRVVQTTQPNMHFAPCPFPGRWPVRALDIGIPDVMIYHDNCNRLRC